MIPINHNCKDELNELNLRATPARIAVLNLFENSKEPIAAKDVTDYLRKKGIKADPVTAFRIVNLFTEKGLTRQISFNEGKLRYELSSHEDHHHFICEKCGEIEDISDCNIEMIENEIRKKKGLLIKSHSLEFFGLCKSCQS